MPDMREEILLICCQVGDPAEQRLARLDALLADPLRRMAILEAMGVEVTDEWLWDPRDLRYSKFLVVRPRGEATDG